MKGNIKLELKTLTPSRLQGLLSLVAMNLEGNAFFPAPPVTPAELTLLAETFSKAISDATEGSLNARVRRDAIAAQVRDTLRLLADYVRLVAQGDREVLTSSGFSLVKEPSASVLMEAPLLKHVVMNGKAGQVKLRWAGVRNRRAYHIHMTEDDPAETDVKWIVVGATGKITHTVTGLVPYKPYWFCVSAIGALGEGVRSGPKIGRAA